VHGILRKLVGVILVLAPATAAITVPLSRTPPT
jgi:hypothetical protein